MKLTKHTVYNAESEEQAQLILKCLDQKVHDGLYGYSANGRDIQFNYNRTRLSETLADNTFQIVKGIVLAIMYFTKDQNV